MEAGGLAEAQKEVQNCAVDVALLDLRSLREEALVLLGVIRNIHPDAQIILLSGPEHIGLCIRGMKQGAFRHIEDAREAYEKCKRENKPRNAVEMARYWRDEVQAQLEANTI